MTRPIEPEYHNSFQLRTKVEVELRKGNAEGAAKLIKTYPGEDSVYSWNLLIKSHAVRGQFQEAHDAYMEVTLEFRYSQ